MNIFNVGALKQKNIFLFVHSLTHLERPADEGLKSVLVVVLYRILLMLYRLLLMLESLSKEKYQAGTLSTPGGLVLLNPR